jgi:hypothetical protein
VIGLNRKVQEPEPRARSVRERPSHLRENDLLAQARQPLDPAQGHVDRVARLVLRANPMWDPLAPFRNLASRPLTPTTPRSFEAELALHRSNAPTFRLTSSARTSVHSCLNRGKGRYCLVSERDR